MRLSSMLEYHPMVNIPGLQPSLRTGSITIPAGRRVLLVAILAITLPSCSSDSAQMTAPPSGGGPVDQFELVDRAGKTYVLTDLYTCAPTDKTTSAIGHSNFIAVGLTPRTIRCRFSANM